MPSSSKRRAAEKKQQSKVSASFVSNQNPGPSTFPALAGDKFPKAADDFEAAFEYDSVSNNGSCSGESEDQLRDKSAIPGLEAPLDKQEKIRLKNEKKHQRQRERRAKELKDRCEAYLMSNKLDRLAEQLVSMGFPLEEATMALILKEGHAEQAISFLLEDGVGSKDLKKTEGSMKLDISEELSRISEIEHRFKFPRQDIERAIVTCEGDIDKACKWLQEHQPATPEPDASPKGTISPLNSGRQGISTVNQQPREGHHHQRPSIWMQPASGAGGGMGMMTPPQAAAAVRGGPWQRGTPPPGLLPITVARPDIRSMPELSHQRSLPPDPRSFHYPVEAAVAKRLEEMLLLNPEQFKPPGLQLQSQHHYQRQLQHQHQQRPQQFLQQHQSLGLHPPRVETWGVGRNSTHLPPPAPAAPAAGNGFDDWSSKACSSVNYESIDWSMGMSLSPCLRPSTNPGAAVGATAWDQQQQHQRFKQPVESVYGEAEVCELLGPDWTTPFTGKELFQHRAVQPL